MRRKNSILGQGSLDGACFLYSLANAVQCLSRKPITSSRWSKLVPALVEPRDFLTDRTGTRNSDNDPNLQEALAQQYLQILSPRIPLTVTTLHGLCNHSEPHEAIFDHSVVVMQNAEHWFCLLEVHGGQAYVACSWVWQRDLSLYKESLTPVRQRTYNDCFPITDLEYYGSRALRVSII